MLLGILAFLMTALAGGDVRSDSFLEFGAALAALVYLLTFANIQLGLAILIVCIGFSPEVSIAGFNSIRFEDFLVPALLAAWILRSLKTRDDPLSSVVHKPFLFYLSAALISCLIGIAFNEIRPGTSVSILGKSLEYYLIFLILLNNIRTYAEFKAFVIFSLLVSLCAAVISGAPVVTEASTHRVHGPEGELANIFGGYIIMHMAILVGLFLHSLSMRGRVLTLLGLAAFIHPLLYTYSRTSYAALTLATSIFALLKHRRLLILVLFALILFPLIAPDAIVHRALTITTVVTEGGPESWRARVSAWEASSPLIMSSPIFGNGLGAVAFGDVDNEYVHVVVDMGMMGLGFLIWLLVRTGLKMLRTYDELPAPGFMKGFVGGYIIALMTIVIHSFGATSLSAIRTMETFMMFTSFAMILAARREEWLPDEEADLREHERHHGNLALSRPLEPSL